jgi:hypothetical protein
LTFFLLKHQSVLFVIDWSLDFANFSCISETYCISWVFLLVKRYGCIDAAVSKLKKRETWAECRHHRGVRRDNRWRHKHIHQWAPSSLEGWCVCCTKARWLLFGWAMLFLDFMSFFCFTL